MRTTRKALIVMAVLAGILAMTGCRYWWGWHYWTGRDADVNNPDVVWQPIGAEG